LIESYIGEWDAKGEIFATPARFTMVWDHALDGSMARLDYEIKMNPGTDRTSSFIGIAYYGLRDRAGFDAFWADNSGRVRPITTRIEDGALVSDWGGYGDEKGRTRYLMQEDGSMKVTDWGSG